MTSITEQASGEDLSNLVGNVVSLKVVRIIRKMERGFSILRKMTKFRYFKVRKTRHSQLKQFEFYNHELVIGHMSFLTKANIYNAMFDYTYSKDRPLKKKR